MPEPNSFPYKIKKYKIGAYHFTPYNGIYSEYAYFNTTHEVKKFRNRNDVSGIIIGNANDLEEAKEIMTKDYNERPKIKEALFPEPNTFPLRLRKSFVKPFSVYYFFEWNNYNDSSRSIYDYYINTGKIYYNGELLNNGLLINKDNLVFRDLEKAKELIANHYNNIGKEVKEGLMPEPAYPFRIVKEKLLGKNVYMFTDWNTKRILYYYNIDSGLFLNNNANIINGANKIPNDLEQAKEFILTHAKKNGIIKEGLMPIRSTIEDKIKSLSPKLSLRSISNNRIEVWVDGWETRINFRAALNLYEIDNIYGTPADIKKDMPEEFKPGRFLIIILNKQRFLMLFDKIKRYII